MLLDKTPIKRSFSGAYESYDRVAGLQRKAGKTLLSAIDLHAVTGTVLDLGCGTGFLSNELQQQSRHDLLLALDIAMPMLHATQTKLSNLTRMCCVCADAENLPLATHSIDSLFSNLALQWCPQLADVFIDFKRVLKPNGNLVFSTFGTQTLQELKAAWASVDHYNHINDFYSAEHIQHFLQAADFSEIKLTRQLYNPRYDSVWSLMRELKQLGAHHVLSGRNHQLTTKTAMQAMIAEYEKHAIDQQITASFEIIYVTARA